MEMGGGVVDRSTISRDAANPVDHLFSEHLACVYGHVSLPEIEPRTFSFNSPHGACPECQGLGVKREFDPDLIVPNADLTVEEGAMAPWATSNDDSWTRTIAALRSASAFEHPDRPCPGAN